MKKITLILFALFMSWQINAQTLVIGTATTSTTNLNGGPIDGYYKSMRYQVVYTAAQLSASLTPYDEITALGFSISTDYGGGNLSGYTIKMGHTSAVNCASHINVPMTVVKSPFSYDPTVTAAGEFDMISFDTNFVWNGSDNVVVEICTDGPNAFTSPYGLVRANIAATNGSRFVRSDTALSCGVNTSTASNTIPNIQFDYSEGTPPSCLAPATLGVENITSASADLIWVSNGTDFDVQYAEAPFQIGEGTIVENVANGYTLGGLSSDTAYQYYVRQDCGNSETSTWSGPYNFFTGYCIPSPSTFPTSYIINGVSTSGGFTNIANATGTVASAGSYGSFTDFAVTQSPGGQFSYSIAVPTFTNVEIWADLNQNLIFEANEIIGTHVYGTTAPVNFTGTITLPTDIALGDYRIRVRSRYYSNTVASPCADAQYGEVEDYTLSVVAPPSCLPPTNVGVGVVTPESAVLTWTSEGTAFDIQWAEAPFSLGQGTIVSNVSNNYLLEGLSPDTSYQYYVRLVCTGETSLWTGPFTFFTGYCGVSTQYTGDYTSSFSTSGAVSNVEYTATAQPAGSYANLTDNVIEQAQGLSFDFSTTYVGGTQGVNIWVDWNKDLVFDNAVGSTEKVYSISSSTATKTGNITIPADVEPGNYRVRVRSQYGTGANPAPCGQVTYGSTLDFTITVLPAPSCFPPTALGVENTTFESTDLVWTSEGTSFDVEWAEAPFTVGEGTLLDNVTSNPYTLTGLAPETAYQYYVRQDCGNNETSFWSGPFNFYTGYCLPSASTSPTSYIINGVSTTGGFTNISNTTGATQSAGSYGNFVDSAVTQSPGGAFTYSVVVPAYTNVELWLDLNNNLIFDADELVAAYPYGTTAPVTFTGTVTLPTDQALGDYRLRVRSRYYFQTTADPCAPAQYGETEDYTVSVVTPPSCLPPTALGVSNLSTESADLTWTSEGTAFDIQYAESPFQLGEGSIIENVTNPYTLADLAPDTNYTYYVRLVCDSDTSLWAGPFSFFTGYCSVSTTSTGDYTTAFSTSGAVSNVAYTATTNPAASYINQTENIIGQAQGLSFDFSTTYQGGSQGVNIWVDWNSDLVFDNTIGSTEKVYSVANSNATKTGTIMIPADVEPGNYRVRVRSQYGSTANPAPCGGVYYGTTIDFTLEVLPAPTCFPPTALGVENTTFESTDLVWTSEGTSFDVEWAEGAFEVGEGTLIDNITSSGYTLSGLTSNTSYQYYVRQDCGNDETSYWSGPYTFYTGYCLPGASTYPTSYIINGFSTLGGFTNISNTTGTTASANSYGEFYNMSVSQSAGGEFTYNVVVPGYTNAELWIDYNQNLVFDADELVGTHVYGTTAPVTFTGTITLPTDLAIGDYRLRVRSRYYFQTTASACAPAQYGETEDYTISVIAPPSCLPPSGLAANFNSPTSVDLTWNSEGTAFEIQYGIAPLTLGQGTIQVVTGTSVTLSLEESTTYQYYVRQDCGATDGMSLWAGPFTFTMPTSGQIGDGAGTNSYFPIYSCYNFNYSQQIYLSSELQAVLEPGSNLITEIRFKPATLPATSTNFGDWVIYFGNTTQQSFSTTSNWIASADMEEVFSGNLSFTAGEWVSIVLDTPFLWDGTSNLVVGVDENTAGYNCTAAWASYPTGSNRGILYYSDPTNPDPATPPTANQALSGSIAQIQLVSEPELSSGQFDSKSFTAYPNPVKNMLNLTYTQNISSVEVFNMLGQKVLTQTINATQGQIDMSNLSTGTYLVKVAADNQVKTIKVIKE